MDVASLPVAKDKKPTEDKRSEGGNIRVSPELSRMIAIIVANRRKRIPNYSAGRYIEPMIEDSVISDYEEEVRQMTEDLKKAAKARRAQGPAADTP